MVNVKPSMKLPQVTKFASSTLTSRPAEEYDDVNGKLDDAVLAYRTTCGQLLVATDADLLKETAEVTEYLRITNGEWLVVALQSSSRETEEKRTNAKAIRKKLKSLQAVGKNCFRNLS